MGPLSEYHYNLIRLQWKYESGSRGLQNCADSISKYICLCINPHKTYSKNLINHHRDKEIFEYAILINIYQLRMYMQNNYIRKYCGHIFRHQLNIFLISTYIKNLSSKISVLHPINDSSWLFHTSVQVKRIIKVYEFNQ